MRRLVQESQTNTHNQWLLCEVRYDKVNSCYTLCDTLSESRITNLVESDVVKYNAMLVECGSSSTVHSASEREKITLLTSSVTHFVTACTQMIQTCTKVELMESFQSLSAPARVKKKTHGHGSHGHGQ